MYKLISRLYKYIINNIFDSYTHSDLYFGSTLVELFTLASYQSFQKLAFKKNLLIKNLPKT